TKLAKQIRNGDFVMGPDSLPRQVSGVMSGYEEMYQIISKYGDPITVNKSHLLYLVANAYINKQYRKGDKIVISVEEYIRQGVKFKHNTKLIRTSIELPEAHQKCDPYVLGAWLGDGSIDKPEITKNNNELIDYLREYASS